MSALDLVERATAILQRHLPPDSLDDQQASAELHAIFDAIQVQQGDFVSQLVLEAAGVMQRHREHALNDHQAMNEMYAIFDGPEANALAEHAPNNRA